jgi:hypothetical protein
VASTLAAVHRGHDEHRRKREAAQLKAAVERVHTDPERAVLVDIATADDPTAEAAAQLASLPAVLVAAAQRRDDLAGEWNAVSEAMGAAYRAFVADVVRHATNRKMARR